MRIPVGSHLIYDQIRRLQTEDPEAYKFIRRAILRFASILNQRMPPGKMLGVEQTDIMLFELLEKGAVSLSSNLEKKIIILEFWNGKEFEPKLSLDIVIEDEI